MLPAAVEGAGAETLVFVHGWPDDGRLWDAQVAHFKRQYRCVRVTMPHFEGRTSEAERRWQPWGYDFVDAAELLAATVRAHSPGGAVCLVLHDWGCTWGFLMQRKYPELVKLIVAMDVGPPSYTAAGWRTLPSAIAVGFAYQYWLLLAYLLNRATTGTVLQQGGQRMADWMARSFARWIRPCLSTEDQADLQGDRITAEACYPYYYFQTNWGVRGAGVAAEGSPEPSCPCLFFYGAQKYFPFHTAHWEKHLKSRADCRVVPMKTSHWLQVERPGEVNEAIQWWLGAVLPAARSSDGRPPSL